MVAKPTGSPALADVARAAGVSKMTVSRVLRGKAGFSNETRDRVMQEVERLGYVPNRLAAAFGKSGASTLVGVCVPNFTSPLTGAMLESLNATLTKLGYQTMIGSHDYLGDVEEAWLRGLATWRPAGVVLVASNRNDAIREILGEIDIPVVEIWTLEEEPIDVSIGFSHRQAGYQMGKHLISRGCRKLGYVGAFRGAQASNGRNRLKGLAMALEEADLSPIVSEIVVDRPGFYSGFFGTEIIFSRDANIDALYFHDDEMAIGGMAWLERKGLKVPDDIAIAGWGGMEAASILPKQLTTTVAPTVRLGRAGAMALVSRIQGETVELIQEIPTQLVVGETS